MKKLMVLMAMVILMFSFNVFAADEDGRSEPPTIGIEQFDPIDCDTDWENATYPECDGGYVAHVNGKGFVQIP